MIVSAYIVRYDVVVVNNIITISISIGIIIISIYNI